MSADVFYNFFLGFWLASVMPFVVGVFLAVKRALWASAFTES